MTVFFQTLCFTPADAWLTLQPVSVMPRLLLTVIFFSSFLSRVGLSIISVFEPTHWNLDCFAVHMLMSQRTSILKMTCSVLDICSTVVVFSQR